LNLREAWTLSKVPYVELIYRSTMMTRGSSGGGGFRQAIGSDPATRVRSIKRGALISKALISIFVGAGTIFAFSAYFADKTVASLVTGVTFSLALSLAYLILYSLQVLPSFWAAGAYVLLPTLPLDKKDLSLVTILSIVRTFDAVVVVALVTQVAAVAYLTASAPAALVMLIASVANSIFGVAISVWLAGVFQRNASRGGRGRAAAALRFVFVISWGLAAASLGFLFNLIGYLFPAVGSAISGALASTAIPILLSVIHPFSVGLAIGYIVYPSISSFSPTLGVASIASFVALAGYILLAYAAANRTMRAVVTVTGGSGIVIVRQKATEFLLRLRRPVPAYLVKDLRVASKNPSTAFVFGLPALETIVIALSLKGGGPLRASTVLYSTALGCFITLVSASILLNTEGSGLDYTLSLPLTARVMVLAKSSISTVSFLTVPAVIGALLFLGSPSVGWLVAIPILEIAAVSAASSVELSFFIRSYKKTGGGQTSRGIEARGLSPVSVRDMARFGVAFLVAGAIVLAPLGTYIAVYLAFLDHGIALVSATVVSIAELIAVQVHLKRSQ